MAHKKRVLVVAGGSKAGGGSGFENLVAGQGRYGYEVVGVTSHIWGGGVQARAERLKIPFLHVAPPYSALVWRGAVEDVAAEFVACSGGVKPIRGLPAATAFNIHPGALPRFGGKGMHGEHVHQATMESYWAGEITETEINFHFVTDFDEDGDYDRGPVFFKLAIPIRPDDDALKLAARVLALEHIFQPWVTHQVVTGAIRWSGVRGEPIIFPRGRDEHWRLAA